MNVLNKIKRRLKNNAKIALVMGSGSAKGRSYIGIIRALEENDIPIHMVVGTSIGAIVGAFYANGGTSAEMEEVVSKLGKKEVLQFVSLGSAITFKSLFDEAKVMKWMEDVIGDIHFSDLKIPLVLPSTDPNSEEDVIINEGSVLEGIRASISLPGILPPVRAEDRFLIDGGFSNPLPVNVAKDMGADYTIACNVIQVPMENKKKWYKVLRRGTKHKIETVKLKDRVHQMFDNGVAKATEILNGDEVEEIPNMFKVWVHAVNSVEHRLVQPQLAMADLVISPDMRHIDFLEFYRGSEAVREGYFAAKLAFLRRENRYLLKRKFAPAPGDEIR